MAKKVLNGIVVSNKMDKTIVVLVERKVKHPLYGKYLRRFSKMYAHDSENACHVGDLVLIKQCRPLSKTKHWSLIKIVTSVASENSALEDKTTE